MATPLLPRNSSGKVSCRLTRVISVILSFLLGATWMHFYALPPVPLTLLLKNAAYGNGNASSCDGDSSSSTSSSTSRQQRSEAEEEAQSTLDSTAATASANTPLLSRQAMNHWCPHAASLPICQPYNHNNKNKKETWRTTLQCQPCQRRWLILLASGRSGSTSLRTMLNHLPGIRLAGENNGMLHALQSTLDQTRQKTQWKVHADPDKFDLAWGYHGPVPNEAFTCVTQQLSYTLNPPPLSSPSNDDDATTILGFKTIRYPWDPQLTLMHDNGPAHGGPRKMRQNATSNNNGRADRRRRLQERAPRQKGDTPQTTKKGPPRQSPVEFLMESFPCARFVVNWRSNVTSQVASLQRTWGRKHDELSLKRVVIRKNAQLQQLTRQLNEQMPHSAFGLDSSQWVHNSTSFNEMVTWLGFDEACHFEEAFEYNTQYGKGPLSPYLSGERTQRDLPRNCRALGD